MKREIRGFWVGIVVMGLVYMSGTAFAESFTKTIEVAFNKINLTVNGVAVEADNLLYNGTTYVPLRAVAVLMGRQVDWDPETSTAHIRDSQPKPPGTPPGTSSGMSAEMPSGTPPGTSSGMSAEMPSGTSPGTSPGTSSGTPPAPQPETPPAPQPETLPTSADREGNIQMYRFSDLSSFSLLDVPEIKAHTDASSYFIGRGGTLQLLRNYLTISSGASAQNFNSFDEATKREISKKLVVFTYVGGETQLYEEDEPYWPMSYRALADGLAGGAFTYVHRTGGTVHLLLAAHSSAELEQLMVCSFERTCPGATHRSQAETAAEVFGRFGKPAAGASAAVIIDLRNPKDRGTAVVYYRNESNARRKLIFNTQDFRQRPGNLQATFDPRTGTLLQVSPAVDQVETNNEGEAVFEVTPYFTPGSFARSEMTSRAAYLRTTALLPELAGQVAVQFLLPDSWEASVPWSVQGGWYYASAAELNADGSQYIVFGPLVTETVKYRNTEIRVAMLQETNAQERQQLVKQLEAVVRYTFDRMGEPPTKEKRLFTYNILHTALQSGGSAGERTATTVPDIKIMAHEMIHWWNGIRFTSDIPFWTEGGTEYLALKTLKETGIWSKQQYDQFMRDRNAVMERYPPAHLTSNVYEGESLAFMRDLDAYISVQSGGKHQLEDFFRTVHAKNEGNSVRFTQAQTIDYINQFAGIDVTPFFNERY